MKRIIAAGFAAALVFAGAATAATPAKQIATLQRQMKTLQKTVAKQQKTIKTLNDGLVAAYAVEFCLAGVTADALQATWTAFDQATGTTVFGPQQTISDHGACNALQLTRQGIRTPPTTSVFSALTALLGASTTSSFRAYDW